MNKSSKQPKAVSSKKAASILKVSSNVRAGVLGPRPCYTCGLVITYLG